MDRDDFRKNYSRDFESQDTYDTRQAKQRASIKWLLSKSYNNKVPENLQEPFYRDHEVSNQSIVRFLRMVLANTLSAVKEIIKFRQDQEHLKPQIVHNLANAELYCLAFANIYSDPNYHNLNHCGILQTLSRKGISIPDNPDGPLTETVLIQTTPLKLGAHMAVIEASMILYAKEVVTPDRVVAAIHRFTHGQVMPEMPQDTEAGLLLWVNHSQKALTQRIRLEMERDGEGGKEKRIPTFPEVKDIKGLCDGAGLAALISFYCPEELPWTDIKIPALPTVSDSVHNLCLVHEFSHHSLPHTVCHMMPEDVTYLQGNMKQNLLVLLADLFNVLEIHPVKCVRFPGSERNRDFGPARNSQGVAHKRSLPQAVTAIPDLRSNLATNSSFTVSRPVSNFTTGIRKSYASQSESTFRGSPDSLDRTLDDKRSEESFVVHRGRAVPTLSSVIVDDPVVSPRLRKDRNNYEAKAEEPSKAAGKPSNWEEQKKSSFAGRRSRRNSLSEESQLTVENFGGSQENLHFLGRNPDKDPAVHISGRFDNSSAPLSPTPNVPVRTSAQEARSTGVELIFSENEMASPQPPQRKDSRKSQSPAPIPYTPNVPVRSSQQDCRSNAIDRIFADNGYGIDKNEEEKSAHEENIVSLKNMIHSKQVNEVMYKDYVDGDVHVMPVHLPDSTSRPEIMYKEDGSGDHINPSNYTTMNNNPTTHINGNEKKTTFAALPNTTTWQQQQKSVNSVNNIHDGSSIPDDTSSLQLHNIRLKLEEKRRVIENEKKRMELLMNKQRQKVGKAAFLQAITKDKLKAPETTPRNDKSTVGSTVDQGSQKPAPQRPFTLQDIKEDVLSIERKWLDGTTPFLDERKTPDYENLDLEKYQFSIAQMNSSLKELDADMQRLSNQQNKLQGYAEELRYTQQQIQNYSNQPQFTNMRPLNNYHNPNATQPQTNYSTYSNLTPQARPISLSQLTQPSPPPNQPQFFLHEQQQQQPPPPQPVQRRTWSQHHAEKTAWNQQLEKNERNVPQPFTLHETRLQNGDSHPSPPPRSSTMSPQHLNKSSLPPKPVVPARQLPPSSSNVYPAPLPTPSADDMEPQSICFIGEDPNSDVNNISLGMTHINITSGSRTYRIPSPTRPSLIKSTLIQKSVQPNADNPNPVKENQPIEKGFYISFDDEAPPKRPKPPLRGKRSPKKERFATQTIERPFEERHKENMTSVPVNRSDSGPRTPVTNLRNYTSNPQIDYSPDHAPSLSNDRLEISPQVSKKIDTNFRYEATPPPPPAREPATPNVGLVIGTEPDPNLIDEMERKKEKILMLSLQRRQQQEEMKARKEMEAAQRREIEKLKEEDRARKKEEEKARRAAILEQYKLKKAIEEAEREGKVIDKADLMKLNTPKLRNKTSTTPRPRPKTIHVESGGIGDGIMTAARGKKGSSTNLADQSRENSVFSRPLRRDQYRGSQDSLASSAGGRRGFRDSPSDEGRGSSPSRMSSTNLGRRGSYKTSRDTSEPPSQVRGRSKYSTYQSNFRGRKSNSLMNLCGSSSDQDSMIYRYGDTDSGLGRATPPRRAPSPGITCGRHLTSPSGPGSLPPGLISKRRIFDDGSSDISSNASSMMEYTGPRLYKQPATKSNRGIMLNAVEYCVFPGAVNKEAKRRVLEEVSRSESKYFLILFRDAGCQFRALYSYCPDTEEVLKLYGTGPKAVSDKMFDKFFKYNSGGKCFSQVHTKHLTVTIDAFTIHNSLWQGKKVNLPSKKDMALVI